MSASSPIKVPRLKLNSVSNERIKKKKVDRKPDYKYFEMLHQNFKPRKTPQQCLEDRMKEGLEFCTFTPLVLSPRRYLSP